MSSSEWTTVLLSISSVVISLWAAFKASSLSSSQLRLSNRLELHKLLLEIDRELLHDPSLFSMFKSNVASLPPSTTPVELAKQDVYVTMYLNMFEVAFAQFKELRRLSSVEREISAAWERFIVSFFQDCHRAKPVWDRFKDTYYASFRSHIDELVQRSDVGEGNQAKANDAPNSPHAP
ncbi:MAG: hypothetical protein WAV47_06615 [Blastocatellia bacterium]